MNGNPVGELTTAVSSGISGSNRQGSELRLGSTGSGNAWGLRRWHTLNSCNRNSCRDERGSEELHAGYKDKQMNKRVNVMLLLMVGFEEEEARNLYTYRVSGV